MASHTLHVLFDVCYLLYMHVVKCVPGEVYILTVTLRHGLHSSWSRALSHFAYSGDNGHLFFAMGQLGSSFQGSVIHSMDVMN